MRKGRVLVLLLLVASITLVVLGVAPSAHAAGCRGYACDGQSFTLCASDQRIPSPTGYYSARAEKTASNRFGYTYRYEATIQLWYSPSCRSVWAKMYVNPGLPAGSNCYAKIQRNSDGKALRTALVDPTVGGGRIAWTPMLNDANVTSHAWGYCAWGDGGPTLTVGTRSY